jgi:hypothetical protein
MFFLRWFVKFTFLILIFESKSQLKKANHNKLEPITGIEPAPPRLRSGCSPIELTGLVKLQISDTGPGNFPKDNPATLHPKLCELLMRY